MNQSKNNKKNTQNQQNVSKKNKNTPKEKKPQQYAKSNEKIMVDRLISILTDRKIQLNNKVDAEADLIKWVSSMLVSPTETDIKEKLRPIIFVPQPYTFDYIWTYIWPNIERHVLDIFSKGITNSSNKSIERIPIASSQQNGLINLNKLDSFLKNEVFNGIAYVNKDTSTIPDKGFSLIPNASIKKGEPIEHILSPIELGNLKVDLQLAIEDIQQNTNITNKVNDFILWYNGLPLLIKRYMKDGITFDKNTYNVSVSIPTEDDNEIYQQEATKYADWWNTESIATRLLLMCLYTFTSTNTNDIVTNVSMKDAITNAIDIINKTIYNHVQTAKYAYPLTNLPIPPPPCP